MKEKGKRFLGIGSILVVGFVIWTVLIPVSYTHLLRQRAAAANQLEKKKQR